MFYGGGQGGDSWVFGLISPQVAQVRRKTGKHYGKFLMENKSSFCVGCFLASVSFRHRRMVGSGRGPPRVPSPYHVISLFPRMLPKFFRPPPLTDPFLHLMTLIKEGLEFWGRWWKVKHLGKYSNFPTRFYYVPLIFPFFTSFHRAACSPRNIN